MWSHRNAALSSPPDTNPSPSESNALNASQRLNPRWWRRLRIHAEYARCFSASHSFSSVTARTSVVSSSLQSKRRRWPIVVVKKRSLARASDHCSARTNTCTAGSEK